MDLSVDYGMEYDKATDAAVDPYNQASIDAHFLFKHSPGVLLSGQRVLLAAAERITMPPDHLGLICLRSTWARLGLLAPTTIVDPGFEGYLTMELFNAAAYDITIRPGDKIWTLVQLPISNWPLYEGRYQYQGRGAKLPRALAPPLGQV